MSTELGDKALRSLLDRFVVCAVRHRIATDSSDYRVANNNARLLRSTYRKVKDLGDRAQEAFLSLLDHPDPAVQGWVARYALEIEPRRSESVLRDLSRGSGLLALDAEMTLKEWRKGTLQFP